MEKTKQIPKTLYYLNPNTQDQIQAWGQWEKWWGTTETGIAIKFCLTR